MAISAKSRSRRDLIVEQDADEGINDNSPVRHLGHELSDLQNVPHQPASEAVVHYARLALIESFPEHPQKAKAGAAAAPPMDANVKKQADAKKPGKRRVAIACVTSFIFHGVLFAALAIGFVITPHDPVEEAGEAISVVMIGDSDSDQVSAGEADKQPQPDEIVAESVQPQTVQPAEVKPTEIHPEEVQPAETQPTTAESVEAEDVPPMQEVTRVSPETVTAAEPEVLTLQAPAETSVVQPMATEVPPETPSVTATKPEEVTPVQPTETAEALPEPPKQEVTPTPKPKAEQPVEKPKPVEKKQPPKTAKIAAGSQGNSKQDSKKGASDGVETANSDRDSRGVGGSGAEGSAAVANYPGKVQSRIRRSVRVPSEYKRMSEAMKVRVSLTIGGSGALNAVSVVRSSGIPQLDQAVVDGVRRAAPFPPLPAEWGKPVWSFTQEVQVTGR
jgi:protein TonB